jgi:hypothetical protein
MRESDNESVVKIEERIALTEKLFSWCNAVVRSDSALRFSPRPSLRAQNLPTTINLEAKSAFDNTSNPKLLDPINLQGLWKNLIRTAAASTVTINGKKDFVTITTKEQTFALIISPKLSEWPDR